MYNKIIKWSIYLLVFLLPLFFLPFSFEAFEFNKQYLLFFLVSLAFFAWIAKMVLVDKEIRFKRTPLDIPVLVFLFVAILSAIFSVDKSSSLFGFYGRFSDGLIGLISLVVLYFLITNNVGVSKEKEEPQNTKCEIPHTKILKIFLWSVFFVILLSYLSIFGIWTKISNLQFIKLPAVMAQRIFNPVSGSLEGLAIFLAVIVCLLISYLVLGEKRKSGIMVSWVLLLAALGLLLIVDFPRAWLVILLTLALFVGLALWKRLLKEDVNKLLLPILIMVLTGTFLFIDIPGFQLAKEQVLNQNISLGTGIGATTENVKSGFLGSGIGTFYYDFSKFKSVEFNQTQFWQIRFDRAGNHFSEILGTMGFLGILSYFFLIGFFLMISWLFLSREQKNLPLLIIFFALVIGQFVYYQNTVLAFSFWLVLGLSVVNWKSPISEKTISFKDFPELSLLFSVLLIALGLAILGMYFFATQFYLADINYKNGIGEAKIQNLEKAAKLNPYQSQYKITLARSYLAEFLTEIQKPEEEIDQLSLSDSVNRTITYARGGYIEGNYIKGATELSPDLVTTWETLGLIYREIEIIATGAVDWGIKSFDRAIELEPASPVLHTELGKLYLVSNDIEKAKEEFNKARELKIDYVDSSIQLALLKEGEGNLSEAIKEMEGLVNSYPFETDALFQLGRLYFNNGQIDEAISQFEIVVLLVPFHSNAHYSLGVAYQRKGETAKAIVEFEKVLELNLGNEDVQQKLEELKK
jgi:putative inorganic carbon (HCO3(-)) transporter